MTQRGGGVGIDLRATEVVLVDGGGEEEGVEEKAVGEGGGDPGFGDGVYGVGVGVLVVVGSEARDHVCYI